MPEAEQRYQGEPGRRYHETKRAIPGAAYPWVARLRAAKLRQYVRTEDVVIEYGVGYGWNLAALTCRRRIGFDVGEFLEPVVQEHGIEFIADSKALAGDLADVVICHHTIEHVRHPAEALVEIHRLLKSGGRLLLFVPFEKERRYRRFQPGEPNHHLYSWNVQALGNLAEDCGFKVLEGAIGRFGYDRFAAVWAGRFRIGETGFRLLRGLLHLIRPLREVRLVAAKA